MKLILVTTLPAKLYKFFTFYHNNATQKIYVAFLLRFFCVTMHS